MLCEPLQTDKGEFENLKISDLYFVDEFLA